MNIDLTAIVNAVIALIAALVSYKLIPWIKAKTTVEQQTLLEITVNTLVFAAEQLYGSGHGDEKFNYVSEELKKRGFTVDKASIEAEVKRAFGKAETGVTE